MRAPHLRYFCALFLALAFVQTAVADELSIDREKYKYIVRNVASELQKNFYDPDLKGVDWKTLTKDAEKKIDNAKNVSEMLSAIHVLAMKLDDSHTAFIPPPHTVKNYYGFDAKPFGDQVYIFALKKNGAAEKAGLRVGDRIVGINGFEVTRKDYDLMMLYFRAVRNVPFFEIMYQRGSEPAQTIKLEAEHRSEARILEAGGKREDLWNLWQESPKSIAWYTRNFDGIGYAQMRSFPYEGEEYMAGVINESKPTKAIILDLRSNHGGSFDTFKAFSGMFTESEIKAGTVEYRKKSEDITIKPHRPHYNLPVVVLVDSNSFSAAEMFARYMQLNKRAIIVGDHTTGKVTMAKMFDEQYGATQVLPYAVYIGVGKVKMQDGNVLEKVGVTPDISCIPTGADIANENDRCLAVAINAARKAAGMAENPDLSVKAIVDRD